MIDQDEIIPKEFQPEPEDWAFDLERAADAVVSLRSQIPADAFTASALGTERQGSGVVIDESGLVVTVGYLITEAEQIWLSSNSGRAVEGHVLAYDQASGFGLVQPAGRLETPVLTLGDSEPIDAQENVILASSGGLGASLHCEVMGRRPFAGYWEYLLEDALFTSPAHPNWGGAACLDEQGSLIGIGSLLIQTVTDEGEQDGNMIVPIQELIVRLDDLLVKGQSETAPRPWLGVFAADDDGDIDITGMINGGPAQRAGLKIGDRIVAVGGTPILDLADFYRKVWAMGDAGIMVPVTVRSGDETSDIAIKSDDRNNFLKKPTLH